MTSTESEHRDFIPYPLNRVVGTVPDTAHACAAIEDLLQAGFNGDAIELLTGSEGVHRLDVTGAEHGVLARFQRNILSVLGGAEEYRSLTHHLEDVRAGRCVIMVRATEPERRTAAADILNKNGAEFVGFYGKWMWTGLPGSKKD